MDKIKTLKSEILRNILANKVPLVKFNFNFVVPLSQMGTYHQFIKIICQRIFSKRVESAL